MPKTLGFILLLLLVSPSNAIEFDFEEQPGMPQEVVDGFVRAGELWENLLDDEITVNVDIGFEQLPLGVLGSTGSQRITVTYTEFLNAIGAQPPSGNDTSAVQSLQAAPAFQMLINRTADHPDSPGNAGTYLDDDGDGNNSTVRLARANAKALGLLDATATESDASITFSSDFNWDFEPDDGIDANHFNFVFVAAHEIGHMLGFTSGVDILDINSPPQGGPFNSNLFTFVSPADLFRFSTESVAEGAGTIDWAADNRPKFFSIDGGTTNLGEYSRGRNFGDGQQASHWRDNLGLGLMDPTVAAGEISQITDLDEQFFDVIGYELADDTVQPQTAEADLQVALGSSLTVTYSLVVSNNGPDDVVGATVANQAPNQIGDITWTCVASAGASCSPSGVGQISDVVDLPAGASVTYTATAHVTGAVNTASVAPPAGISDPVPDNNSNEP